MKPYFSSVNTWLGLIIATIFTAGTSFIVGIKSPDTLLYVLGALAALIALFVYTNPPEDIVLMDEL